MLDELDRNIIIELQEDSRKSFTEIGKKYGISPQTVSDRLEKLKDSGVITHMTLMCDPRKIDKLIRFIVGIKTDLQRGESTKRELKKLDFIHCVFVTTGEYDLFCVGLAKDIDNLGSIIEHILPGIEGIRSTRTFVVTEETKNSYEKYF